MIMKELEKRIPINENRILIYRISPSPVYGKPTYTIMEGFLENGELIKTYDLSQWDDYGLNGWINNDKDTKKISFEFDMDHPLYFPLFHLLNYDDELLIDDDGTREDNKRYMLVHREKDKIFMEFIDELDSIYISEKFRVFIKNIRSDGRSKIDQNYKDTKIRLLLFFNEVYNVLMNDYHQISIEEHLLRNATNDECKELKKTFQRKYN